MEKQPKPLLSVPCPHCAAPRGSFCISPSGRFIEFHVARYQAAGRTRWIPKSDLAAARMSVRK